MSEAGAASILGRPYYGCHIIGSSSSRSGRSSLNADWNRTEDYSSNNNNNNDNDNRRSGMSSRRGKSSGDADWSRTEDRSRSGSSNKGVTWEGN